MPNSIGFLHRRSLTREILKKQRGRLPPINFGNLHGLGGQRLVVGSCDMHNDGSTHWSLTQRLARQPMDSSVYTVAEQIDDTSAQRQHLVILGAGASVASCPNGDKWGTKLPVMANLIETLGLTDDFDAAGVKWEGHNFEDVYSGICKLPEFTTLTSKMETKVAEYFASLELPNAATIYDYLVLCLRPKDVIATFNWDPFLWQACSRNLRLGPLPNVLFLHGCAVVGYCWEHKKQGPSGADCPICGHQYQPTRLLYPVAEKDYVSDPYIASQWKTVEAALESAFVVTVFGYGAPKTDKAAVELLKQGWGSPEGRSLEEFEIIDIREDEDLRSTWDPFIHSHHYQTTDDFFESLITRHPRRTCEALWQSLLEARFREANPVPKLDSIAELHDWFGLLIDAEQKNGM